MSNIDDDVKTASYKWTSPLDFHPGRSILQLRKFDRNPHLEFPLKAVDNIYYPLISLVDQFPVGGKPAARDKSKMRGKNGPLPPVKGGMWGAPGESEAIRRHSRSTKSAIGTTVAGNSDGVKFDTDGMLYYRIEFCQLYIGKRYFSRLLFPRRRNYPLSNNAPSYRFH